MRTAIISSALMVASIIASIHYYFQHYYTVLDLNRVQCQLHDSQTEEGETRKLAEQVMSQYKLPLSEGARKVLLDELVSVAISQLPRGEAREAFFLVLAIESRFGTIQKQVSPAGAQGIAQIMPQYAVSLAKECGLGVITREEIGLRNVNLALGACHFARLYRQYGGNIYLAMGAYNAGSGRIGDGSRPVPGETAQYVYQAATKRGK